MADDDDGLVVEPGQSADQRVVVGIHAIAVQLLEIGEALVDVVERVRPLRMTRELSNLPRRQVGEDAARQRFALVPQARDLLADVELGVVPDELQCVDPRFELCDRLFKSRNFKSIDTRATSGAGTLPGTPRA